MTVLRRLALLLLLAASILPAAVNRIVSLSPNITEILYGVGAFPRVVGVSQYCTYPPEVSKLPRIGAWQTSDIEKIIALHPDLVVLTEAQEPFMADKLRAFAVHWIAVPSQSLAEVFVAVQRIGDATGMQPQASRLASEMHSRLDAIRAATRNLAHPSVLLNVGRTPGTLNDLYVATEGSFLIELVEIAGGRSVVAPAREGYGKISKEAILSLNPDVIIDLVHDENGTLAEHTVEVWHDLPELQAVRTNRVYPVTDDFVVHPSQFVTRTAELFLHLLHPEVPLNGQH